MTDRIAWPLTRTAHRALFWVLDRIDRRVCRWSNDLGGTDD